MTIQSDPVPSDRCEKCGRYEKASIEQCFIGDRDCPRVRTLAPTRETAPNDFQILAITTAYEQGYGHGREHRGLPNPYSDGYLVKAWDHGYEVGGYRADRERAITGEPVALTDEQIEAIYSSSGDSNYET